jgi:hypothetical protein
MSDAEGLHRHAADAMAYQDERPVRRKTIEQRFEVVSETFDGPPADRRS